MHDGAAEDDPDESFADPAEECDDDDDDAALPVNAPSARALAEAWASVSP
tara:strand:+ start:308 stop:457 length:150 start_codon:yes stop_codon:yes gene_type:complete